MSNESNPFSDKDIVTNILNGNIQGFAIVVKNTEKLVTQIVRKMTTNEDDQKDIVQDIYLKAYQNLSSFQFKSKLSTWIANIAYNTTINYLQKKKIPIVGIEETIENKFIVTENPELVAIKTETLEILNAAIDSRSLTKSQFYFIFTKNLIEDKKLDFKKLKNNFLFQYFHHFLHIPSCCRQ